MSARLAPPRAALVANPLRRLCPATFEGSMPTHARNARTHSDQQVAQIAASYQKGRASSIFQAQARAIDDFTLKGKPRNGSIDKF